MSSINCSNKGKTAEKERKMRSRLVEIKSKLVLEFLNVLKNIAYNVTITLMWVPDHVGIEYKERADEPAGKGVATSIVQPRSFCWVYLQTVCLGYFNFY